MRRPRTGSGARVLGAGRLGVAGLILAATGLATAALARSPEDRASPRPGARATPAASTGRITPSPEVAARRPAAQRVVALTFDDLPWADQDAPLDSVAPRTARIVAALRAHHAPAVAFVIGRRALAGGDAERRLDLLREWRDAGVQLGNHTWSHSSFQTSSLAAYEDDVMRGDAVPRLLMGEIGGTPRYFRPPFNQTGPTLALRDSFAVFLHERRYALAPFTVEDADYAFDALYRAAAGDTARQARIGRAYLGHFDTIVSFDERLSRETFGRDIPQVLLLHADDLNAVYAGRLLDRLERRGYRFITLGDALADAAYATPDGYAGRWGISWLHRWRKGLGLPDSLRAEPDPPAWVLHGYQALRRP